MVIVKKMAYTLLLLFIILHAVAAEENGYMGLEAIKAIKSDLPSFIDLMVYLPLLNRIVDFCDSHNKIMTLNLSHGLFLMNVNLEPFAKDTDIPAPIRNDLGRLLERSANLKDSFNSGNGVMRKHLAHLTDNVTQWSSHIPKLNLNLLQRTYAYGEFPPWETYIGTVENIFKGVPNPKDSDKCVASLTEIPPQISASDPVRLCNLPDHCTQSLVNGTDFGYWLTHRFILLSMAHLSRGCTIFSPHEDRLYRMSFCEKAYREAQYIAMHDFQIVDLMLEQIALCTIDGHAQFLRKSWLTNLIDYQQTSGCFQLRKVKHHMENITTCDDHATGVGAATYAAATRFILEKIKRLNISHELS